MSEEEAFLRRFASALQSGGVVTETGSALKWVTEELDRLRKENEELRFSNNIAEFTVAHARNMAVTPSVN